MRRNRAREGGDQRKLVSTYTETRGEGKAYSSLVFQVLALLLTTLTLIMGWVAKDFIFDTYRTAIATTAPVTLTAPSEWNPEYGILGQPLCPEQIDVAQFAIDKRFLHLMWRSPITSLLASSSLLCFSILLGILVVLTYSLQRTRYLSYALERELGLKLDRPVVDQVLTGRSLSFMQGVVGLGVLFIGLYALLQFGASEYFSFSVGSWTSCLMVLGVFALAALKTACSYNLGLHFWRWDFERHWDERWIEAPAALAQLKQRLQHCNSYLKATAATAQRAVAMSSLEEAQVVIDRLIVHCRAASGEESWRRKSYYDEYVEPEGKHLRELLGKRGLGQIRDARRIIREPWDRVKNVLGV